jgi:hypothetical protein
VFISKSEYDLAEIIIILSHKKQPPKWRLSAVSPTIINNLKKISICITAFHNGDTTPRYPSGDLDYFQCHIIP